MPLDANRFAQLRQNLSAVNQAAGQTAIWRQYISASAQLAEYGQGTALYYVQRPITGLFQPLKPMEVLQAGGFYQVGDVRLTVTDSINIRDEFVWDNTRYQVVSEPVSTNLFGVPSVMTVIRRA